MDSDEQYMLLEIQDVLLNNVTPELRAVTVDLNKKNETIVLCFFYDGEITERLEEIASIVGTNVNVPGYMNDENIVRLDFPTPIPVQGHFAFLRNEPGSLNYNKKDRDYVINEKYPIIALKLDMQAALLGRVTPSLRSVKMSLDTHRKRIVFLFVYDGEISEKEFLLAKAAIQEARRLFRDFECESRIERVDFPGEIPDGQATAYWRRELEI